MKILHFSKFYPPYYGGIETVAYDIVEGVNLCNDIICDVICTNNERRTVTEVNGSSIIVRASILGTLSSTPISFSLFWEFLKAAKKYDIIHIHHPNPLASVSLLLAYPLIRKKKILIHWHSDIVKQKYSKIIFSPLQKWMNSVATKIITTSPDYASSSKDLKNYISKVHDISIGIDSLAGKVDENFLFNLKSKYLGKFIVFSLGRHIYYKGFEYLIRAAKNTPPDSLFLIGGTGHLTDYYRELISSLGLENKVILIGKIPQDELAAYYSLCDVFCLPSVERSEAFGVVQLEAMSLGKPVISTSISGSGVPWVNQHEKSGLTVQPKSATELTNAVNLLMSNCELYEKLCKGSKERFDNYFTKKTMIEHFETCYRGLMK
ncbi:glycosyltransferase [Vibrio fluvialis]|nr:glycosyltransferase [Vibrio fluvialis]